MTITRVWLLATCAVTWVAFLSDAQAASEGCVAVESDAHMRATESLLADGLVIAYQEVDHRDIGAVMEKYWNARQSGDVSQLRTLLPALREEILDRAIRNELSSWRGENVKEVRPVFLMILAKDGTVSVVVYTAVVIDPGDRRCIRTVAGTRLVFDNGWYLKPDLSERLGGFVLPY